MKQPQIGDIFQIDFSYSKEQVTAYAALSGDTNPTLVKHFEALAKCIFKIVAN